MLLNRSRAAGVLALALASLAPRPAPAATIVVPDDHATLQAAIAASTSGDSIAVRPGTYTGSLSLAHEVHLVGLGGMPVLDGTGITGVAAIVTTAPLLVADFRITNWAGRCSDYFDAAGAMETFSSVELHRVEIVGNGIPLCTGFDTRTGGIALSGTGSLIARDCLFQGNMSDGVSTICAMSGTVDLRDCQFLENDGAQCITSSGGVLESCRFEDNEGMAVNADSVHDCQFLDNSTSRWLLRARYVADSDFTGNSGVTSPPLLTHAAGLDALRCRFLDNAGFQSVVELLGTSSVIQVLFARNTPGVTGGVLVNEGATAAIQNCTFLDLTVGAAVTALGSATSLTQLTVERSIFVDLGDAPMSCDPEVIPVVGCNDLWNNAMDSGCLLGLDNFFADPQFCDVSADDYTLEEASPCAAANSPQGCGLVGAYDVACLQVGASPPPLVSTGRLRVIGVTPLPSSGPVKVWYELPRADGVRLAVHDAAGRLVRHIASGPRSAGLHAVTWDGRDRRNRLLPAGVYFFCISSGRETAAGKVLLFR